MDGAADGAGVLLHGFEQGRLRLRRRSVDFVGEDNLREQRARLEAEDALAGFVFVDDIGAHDVRRHQIGRELDAVEVQIEHLTQGPHQQRLAQTGDAFQQGMAADEQAGQDAVDDIGVPDDDLADFLEDLLVFLAELLYLGLEFIYGGHAGSLG